MAMHSKDGKINLCVWKDSALVFNVTTCYNVTETTTTRKLRQNGEWQILEITCPESIKHFNNYMGGVDNHDHLRSSYTTQRKSKIWWHHFLWFSVDVCLINSYLLWKENHRGLHKTFQLEVCIILPVHLTAFQLDFTFYYALF